MRILFSAYAISPSRGSEPGNSWRLAEELARRGHHLEVVTTSRYSDEWKNVEDFDGRLNIHVVDDAVPWLLRRGQIGVYARYLSWQQRSLRLTRELDAAERLDVIHHYSWGSLVWGSPLWRVGRSFVFGPVGGGSVSSQSLMCAMPKMAVAQEQLRGFLVHLYRFNQRARRTIFHAQTLWANSDTAKLVDPKGFSSGASTLTIESTVESLLQIEDIKGFNQRRNLLWVGRAMPRKGLGIALEVLRKLPAEIHLKVLGDGPDLTRAKTQARDLGLIERVEFAGHVSLPEVQAELDACLALLFTSIRDTFGAQVLEAASRGVPVIAIKQQGIADFVPDSAGVLVPVGTVDEVSTSMANGVLSLISCEEAWVLASQASLAFAKSHRLVDLADKVEAIYEKVVRVK